MTTAVRQLGTFDPTNSYNLVTTSDDGQCGWIQPKGTDLTGCTSENGVSLSRIPQSRVCHLRRELLLQSSFRIPHGRTHSYLDRWVSR
jgi:hypothetical protein